MSRWFLPLVSRPVAGERLRPTSWTVFRKQTFPGVQGVWVKHVGGPEPVHWKRDAYRSTLQTELEVE